MAHLKTTTILNTKLFIKTTLLTLALSVLSMTSCKSQNSTIPYKAGQSYLFKVTVTDSIYSILQTDTLTLTISNKGLFGRLFGMNMAEWKSSTYKDNIQQRGINIESDFVEIQMPINYDYLENENLVIAGYPSYSKSMLIGYTSESDHQFVAGYGKLAGKKLKQYKSISDSSMLQFKSDSIKCKVAEYKNINGIEDFRLYKLQTYYNTEYGFIKMHYEYPNGKVIEIVLIEIKKEP